MFEKIITFITPGSLSERFGFRARVFTSWISLGFVLGLIFGIASLSSGVPTPNGPIALILAYIISFPIPICIFGLMGLGLNSMRGGEVEHPGWYWWLFPIVNYIIISFWLAMLLLGFFLALAGINLPSKPTNNQPRINPDKIREEVKNMKVEDLLKKFDKQFKQIEEENQLKPQEKKLIKKLRSLDRAALRSRLRDALSDDEMEVLIELILWLIGFSKR